jgi:hypothetical protein
MRRLAVLLLFLVACSDFAGPEGTYPITAYHFEFSDLRSCNPTAICEFPVSGMTRAGTSVWLFAGHEAPVVIAESDALGAWSGMARFEVEPGYNRLYYCAGREPPAVNARGCMQHVIAYFPP